MCSVLVCSVLVCECVQVPVCVCVHVCVLEYATQMLHMWNLNIESIRTLVQQLASSQIIDEQGIISSPV